jgi:uncharacterized membrane protein YgcG
VKINNFKNKIFVFLIEGCFIFGIFLNFTNITYAIETYIPLETVNIGEFIYNDDYTPTADDCTIDIYSPSLVSLVSTTMTDEGAVAVTGWHYHTYIIPATEGKYPTYITCGSVPTGDLFKLDKTFIVKAPSVTSTDISGAVTTINSNVDSKTSPLATSSVLALVKASTDTINWTDITSLPANVWTYSARTLTSLVSIASDIWGATTRTLTSLPWTVNMSNFGTISAGNTYFATVTTIYNGTLTDSANLPTITVYDANRNIVVSGVPMTRTSAGTYGYSYLTDVNAAGGVWESKISADVEASKTLSGNDYWNVTTSPPQVIINSISDDTVPSIGANVTITNEGLSGYEYQYEWCVTTTDLDPCGGGNDIFTAFAAKYINPGEDFNTILTGTVPNQGDYYFRVKVSYGIESSSASRSFTAITSNSNSGSGGSSGGSIVLPKPSKCSIKGDFNCDGKINSIDFSILIYYFLRTTLPFKNQYVDMNKDNKVDSVDFSIFLYNWGK